MDRDWHRSVTVWTVFATVLGALAGVTAMTYALIPAIPGIAVAGLILWEPLSSCAGTKHIALVVACNAAVYAACGGVTRSLLNKRQRERELAPRCPNCSYSLIGNVSGICPECGRRAVGDG